MSERKDEKWLDDRLRRAVDGTTPVFDAESWKRKHPRAFETLVQRSGQPAQSGTRRAVRLALRTAAGRLTIAAAVLLAAGILLIGQFEPSPARPVAEPPSVESPSPAHMVSMISLSAAFRRGGIEELDQQCKRALQRLGPRPTSVSMQELFKDING
jgi:hypothetical protein